LGRSGDGRAVMSGEAVRGSTVGRATRSIRLGAASSALWPIGWSCFVPTGGGVVAVLRIATFNLENLDETGPGVQPRWRSGSR
jgi:hypothetical protein